MTAEKKKVYGNMRIMAIQGKDLFRAVANAFAVRFGQYKKNIQVIMMRFVVNREYQATNLLTVKHNAVGFAFGIVDRFLNRCTRNDLTVIVNMVVTLAELHHRAILERPLIVKDKLLTVICCEGNKSNLRVFHNYLQNKK